MNAADNTLELEKDETGGWPIADRVENVRLDLFTTTAIVEIARRAISPDSDWYLHQSLRGVVEQLEAACTKLELIAGDARGSQEAGHE